MVLTKQSVVTSMTVGFVPVFFEGSFVELLQAEGADKVFRVKLSKHGGDAAAGNRLAAAGAGSTAHLMVVVLAVRETLVLEKVAVRERLVALPEKKRNAIYNYETVMPSMFFNGHVV